MFEYELHRIRSAELIREAQDDRLAREALRGRRAARRAARRASAEQDGEGRAHSPRPRRHPFTRAA
ncbi:hypothetical protein AB0912_33615 [Streptomyces sp. NPDC007084]|uniref:hypothetical protein n=1 Tax=Streptomyces sp. NPDC007084 TaxID=3154313 RepID=UPI0034554BFC